MHVVKAVVFGEACEAKQVFLLLAGHKSSNLSVELWLPRLSTWVLLPRVAPWTFSSVAISGVSLVYRTCLKSLQFQDFPEGTPSFSPRALSSWGC